MSVQLTIGGITFAVPSPPASPPPGEAPRPITSSATVGLSLYASGDTNLNVGVSTVVENVETAREAAIGSLIALGRFADALRAEVDRQIDLYKVGPQPVHQ